MVVECFSQGRKSVGVSGKSQYLRRGLKKKKKKMKTKKKNWGEIAPPCVGGGGGEPLFPTPAPGMGSFVGVWGANCINMAMVVILVFKDMLVPGHFRLFVVTMPHKGLPFPHN